MKVLVSEWPIVNDGDSRFLSFVHESYTTISNVETFLHTFASELSEIHKHYFVGTSRIVMYVISSNLQPHKMLSVSDVQCEESYIR